MTPSQNNLPKESHSRSIFKGVTWRVLATFTTMIIAYVVTNEIEAAAAIGGIEMVAKLGLYYGHERLWTLIPIGASKKVEG